MINSFQITFHYDASYWSDYEEYNLPGGKTGFDKQETKLPTYWNTSFSKICLGMKIGQHIQFIVINKQAHSLYSLIADEHYRSTSLGRGTWKKLIGSQASLQHTATRKGSMSFVIRRKILEQELVSLATMRTIVTRVTQGLDLAQEGSTTTLTRVVTKPCTPQIMEINILKPWDTSWYNEKEIFHIIPIIYCIDEMTISRIARLPSWIWTCVSIEQQFYPGSIFIEQFLSILRKFEILCITHIFYCHRNLN